MKNRYLFKVIDDGCDFSKYSIRSLKTTYNLLKHNLYKENQWQLEEFKLFCKTYRVSEGSAIESLNKFEKEYSSRINLLVSLKYYLKTLEEVRHKITSEESKHNLNSEFKKRFFKKRIKLKDENGLDSFLVIVMQLKSHLKCNNDEIIDIIYRNIDTGFSKKTLLKYYYSCNSEKNHL